ncbi:hypothetical protein GCM10027052_07680 [Parafrigoribacterium mesophilum]|uniref:nuclear transport factor 2 family protein n=1 Tax=Parafrigoribacterium mesophilum TaxID=433646 RepID=UPI0031FDD1FB
MADTDAPLDVVQRLVNATNEHDLAAMVACFATDYRNETPAHPSRSFTGSDQVRANWEQILRFVPDLRSTLVRTVVDGDTVWTEWEQRGTRLDGGEHAMAGIVILGITAGLIQWARFYLEPVTEGGDINQAVREQFVRAPGESS